MTTSRRERAHGGRCEADLDESFVPFSFFSLGLTTNGIGAQSAHHLRYHTTRKAIGAFGGMILQQGVCFLIDGRMACTSMQECELDGCLQACA